MVCKQEIRASSLSGTISTNARITQHIDDMREAVCQVPRRSYAAWCEWRRLEGIDVQNAGC